MRVYLLVPDAIGKLDGRLFSSLASVRLRCLEIAPYLAKLGYRPRLVLDRDVPNMVRDGSFFDADAYVNFKTTYNLQNYLVQAIERGKPVLLDICDNVFSGPDAEVNEALLSVATIATSPTTTLADMISTRGATAVVIPDCIEGEGSPETPEKPIDLVRLLWFGRQRNAAPLFACLDDISRYQGGPPCQLTLVCDDALDLANTIQDRCPGFQVDGIEWSPTALTMALTTCHIVLTPMSDDPLHVAKSANRLAHALWHGRPVATQTFASLDPLREYVSVSADLGEAIDDMTKNWTETVNRTQAGRLAVEREFHPEVIAGYWDNALRQAGEMVKEQELPDQGRSGIRLNIGCGDKILPYYINIDALPERDGYKADMVCDARDLAPFVDNSVDEVLSVHLIEHIPRWDVPATIAEWARVLKPGGQMVIECPNILSACEALLKAPESALHHTGEVAQRTMWAFYGDPGDGDPLMMHKWGYTPQSLCQLLIDAGLEEVRSEAPRFKLGAPRDLRVVGTKRG